jgi:quercetin dioxygenase-like cupin family protein
MEIRRKEPSRKGEAASFVGDVWIDRITDADEPSRIRVNVVRFAPGARNAWHSHTLGQTLHVTEGIGRVQARGEALHEIRAGDTVFAPPGEWHWHGAAPDHYMTHLAIWAAPPDGPESTWAEAVTDEEYLAPPIRGSADPA